VRGKHGTRSALRREDQEVTQTLESYQHQVQRLTRELAKAKEDLRAGSEIHAKEMRVMKTRLNEGLSPELVVYREQFSSMKAEVEAMKARTKDISKSQDRLIDHLMATLVASGWRRGDAMDWLIGADDGQVRHVISQRKVYDKYDDTRAILSVENAQGAERGSAPPYKDAEWKTRYDNARRGG